jgi:hypothetical protein
VTPVPTHTPTPTATPPVLRQTASGANIRECSRLNCTLITSVPRGTVLTVLGQTSGETVSGSSTWFRVQFLDGAQGYIHSSLLVSVDSSQEEDDSLSVIIPTITHTRVLSVSPTANTTVIVQSTQARLTAQVPRFDESEYVRQLYDGLFILAGGRDVDLVQVADGRANGGERVIIVGYRSTESNQVGIVEEWLDLFNAIAATIRANNLDVDYVQLLMGDPLGNVIGFIGVRVSTLLARHQGEISEGAFINALQIDSLTGE